MRLFKAILVHYVRFFVATKKGGSKFPSLLFSADGTKGLPQAKVVQKVHQHFVLAIVFSTKKFSAFLLISKKLQVLMIEPLRNESGTSTFSTTSKMIPFPFLSHEPM